MNSIIKRVVSLFSSQEPQSDIPPPSAERKKTPDQSPVMNDPKPVSVVVSPPAFDLDSYESFDEDYFRRTVDEILSDQASFENSFDAYSGTKMMDGTCERKASMARDSGLGSSGHKASPYFPSKVAKKRPVAHRVIQKMESTEDEDDSEECQSGNKVVRREDPADSVVKIKLEQLEKRRLGDVGIYAPDNEVGSAARASSVIDVDACDDENFEEVSEERFVFASVSEEEHDRLVRFLVDHPFMREGAYPVKRSVRRRFISDVRREASYSGMDEGALGVLTKWIKKTYLEVCMVADADKEGSEFGDEIDDENVLEHRSRSKSKKDRKRKRTSIDQAREKTKTKKTKTKKSDISMVPSKQDVREVINIDSDDSAIAISKSPSTDIQVLEKAPVPQSDLQRTPTSHHIHPENAKHGRVVIEHATPKAPTTPSNHRGNERSISSKESSLPMPRYHNSTSKNDVNSNKRIQPASQEDIARKESSKKRTVSSADLPSSHSKDELQKIAENREKRKKKKKKKKRCDDKNKRRLDRQEKRRSEKSETIPESNRLSRKGDQQATHIAGPISQEHPAKSISLPRKAVSMDDPFWDMDF
ncbi:pre-mRNA splicing factor [Aspergillus flavus]|nr:pre-mRNA splicing factor [Aspergillus flavus]